MILCDYQIATLTHDAKLVDPYNPDHLNPASYDLTLGHGLMIESIHGWIAFPDFANATAADPFLLKPGQLVLAAAAERVNLPRHLCAQFVLKSSRAREGIEHLMAGFADPGYCGNLTLELHNSRQLQEVPIWPGQRIGQLVFHMMSQRPNADYSVTGRYQGDVLPEVSRG